jgi:DEAD/DEAH box helicase domain-containing protein
VVAVRVVNLDGSPFQRPSAEWSQSKGLSTVLEHWRSSRRARDFHADVLRPAQPAKYLDLPADLSPALKASLQRQGIERLFCHQVQSYEHARAGHDLVVATPTASGKSLCYNLPILDRLLRNPSARALYLFPTKALARDQEHRLHASLQELNLKQGAVTYDGDTPGDARRSARERSGLVISNPDMLHAGILPHHTAWARFFSNLEFVVIDELHMYRGVFGSHLANVIRRLQRIAEFHGSRPQFIFASATIGNPQEHASRLIGREAKLVDENGAPQGERRFLLYNPPIINAELGLRASYVKSTVRLAVDLLKARVPTLIFGQSRSRVEVMLKYLRDRKNEHGVKEESIQAYRGGYLPKTRRRIEQGLRDGEVLCVVATNALELGIDIGSLDAVICAGYPGSIAGLWQRFGRAGRREGESLALMVASSAPLDQFLARDPDLITGAPIEQARVDPDNIEIILQHLKCAAFELPFEDGESFGNVPAEVVSGALGFLAEKRVLHPVVNAKGRKIYHWSDDSYPASAVSLRSASWDNVVIIDVELSKTIAEMDWLSTHTMLHEQAIYQHEGEQYQVEHLDHENHKAFVRKVEPDYYTTAMTHGEVNVVEKVVGYKKIKFHTHENVGYGEVQLPEIQRPTTAWWATIPASLIRRLDYPRPSIIDGLRGLSIALHTVACLGLMIDPRDLGRRMVDPLEPTSQFDGEHRTEFDPTIFLFDAVAGGTGLASRIYEDRRQIFFRARDLVQSCECIEGCPSCVGPVIPGESEASRKQIIFDLFQVLAMGAVH